VRHTDRKRNFPSLFVLAAGLYVLAACLYLPRVFSYVGGRQGCRLSENGNASRDSTLRASVCPNTVDRDGVATFSNHVRKGPAGEEQYKAMV
jgi:hypothetical protein